MSLSSGRQRRSAEEMARLGAEYQGSGCSLWEFAQRHGVHGTTVRRWVSRSNRRVPQLVPVRMKVGGGDGGEMLEILSPGGWRVRVSVSVEASTLRRVVEGLGVC